MRPKTALFISVYLSKWDDSKLEKVATFKYYEDAARFIVGQKGGEIRFGKIVLWREGKETVSAKSLAGLDLMHQRSGLPDWI